MREQHRARRQLTRELAEIRRQIARLEPAEVERTQTDDRLRRNRGLALLGRMTRALHRCVELDAVLVTVLGEVCQLLEAAGASLWLVDEESNDLVCRQVAGPRHEIVRGWRLSLGRGIARSVVLSGESLLLPDAWAEQRNSKNADGQPRMEKPSILTVPLRVGRDVIGVVQVVNTDADLVNALDFGLVEAIADGIATAINDGESSPEGSRRIRRLERWALKEPAGGERPEMGFSSLLARGVAWIARPPWRRNKLGVPSRVPAFRLAVAAAAVTTVLLAGSLSLSWWLGGDVARPTALSGVNGSVEVLRAGGGTWEQASDGAVVAVGERIRTAELASAELVFFDGSVTELEAETELTISQTSSRRDGGGRLIVLHQWIGRTYHRVRPLSDPGSRFEVETPTAVAVVRGTEFRVTAEADGTTGVDVVEGYVDVMVQETTVALQAGETVLVQHGQPPVQPPALVAEPPGLVAEAAGPPAEPPGPPVEPPGPPEEPPQDEGSYFCENPDAIHPLAMTIAGRYDVTYEEVMHWFCEDGVSFGQIVLAVLTAETTGESADTCLSRRAEGEGWGLIWQDLGLIGRPEDTGPPAEPPGRPEGPPGRPEGPPGPPAEPPGRPEELPEPPGLR